MASDKAAPGIDFSGFVLSFASSVVVNLGEADDPSTGKKGAPDFAAAQQSIDMLAMLQEKTRGNLTEPERKLLEGILYDVRMLFVQVSKKTAAPK